MTTLAGKPGQFGFIDFDFLGMQSIKIDWLNTKINIWIKSSTEVSKVKPVFRTVRKNAVVTINDVQQESGKSVVDFTNTVVYKITVLGDGEKD